MKDKSLLNTLYPSIELLSARTKHFITTNCFSVKCWWGNTCSDN